MPNLGVSSLDLAAGSAAPAAPSPEEPRRPSVPDHRWTAEEETLLARLAAENRSASQIAAELGCGLTRNAVIGKMSRLGIERVRPAPAAAPPVAPTRARAERPAPADPPAPPPPPAAPAPAPAPATAPRVARPRPATVIEGFPAAGPLADLRTGECHYPIGDPYVVGFRFCCARSPLGGPYCPKHDQITHVGGSTARRVHPAPALSAQPRTEGR